MVKLMMAEFSLLTEWTVSVGLGWAGFLGVLGVPAPGVSGGVSGAGKHLAAAEMAGRGA